MDSILARRVPRSGGREILGAADISRPVDRPTEKPSFLTHPKIGSDGHVQLVEKKAIKLCGVLFDMVDLVQGWLSTERKKLYFNMIIEMGLLYCYYIDIIDMSV